MFKHSEKKISTISLFSGKVQMVFWLLLCFYFSPAQIYINGDAKIFIQEKTPVKYDSIIQVSEGKTIKKHPEKKSVIYITKDAIVTNLPSGVELVYIPEPKENKQNTFIKESKIKKSSKKQVRVKTTEYKNTFKYSSDHKHRFFSDTKHKITTATEPTSTKKIVGFFSDTNSRTITTIFSGEELNAYVDKQHDSCFHRILKARAPPEKDVFKPIFFSDSFPKTI